MWKRLFPLLLVALPLHAQTGPDLLKPPPKLSDSAPRLTPLLAKESKDAWLAQRAALSKQWQTHLGQFPREKAPLKTEILATEDLPDFTRQRVRYQIEDGVFTDGYLLTPKRATGKLPAVVVFHQTVKTHAQQVAGVDASNPELMQGAQLTRRGYIALCPRCFIFDDGTSYSGNVALMQQRHPDWPGMTRMTWDGIRAVDFLESLPNVDRERIGGIGHSLGAKEVLYAAAFDERYKAAVFSEGGIGLRFSNWEAVWYLGPKIRQPDFALEHHQLMALIAPRAFLLLAGESADGDRSWPFIEATLPIYKLLGAEKNLGWLNHRAGHRYPPAAQEVAVTFLDAHLKR